MKTPSRTRNQDTLAESRKYNTLCVCQICTCGHHRCPPSSHVPFRGETTYNHDYKPCTGIISQIRKPCINHYHERKYDPALLKTTYDAEFKPHKIENPTIDPANSRYQYRPRSGKFYDETQYKKNFDPKQITIEKPRDFCNKYTPKRTKFQGTTTYNSEFSPKKADNAFVPANYNYQRRKVPFQGKTTYNTEFKPHQLQPTSTWCNGCNKCGGGCQCRGGCNCGSGCNCAYVPRRSGKFEGESNYKANYKPYQIPRDNHCPILDLPQYPRQCSPGKTHLNYSAQKNKWQ